MTEPRNLGALDRTKPDSDVVNRVSLDMSAPDFALQALGGGAHPVAIDGANTYSADDFKRQVEGLYRTLVQTPEQSIGIWLSSSWDFLCVFCALALAGKRIVMPHNLQTGSAGQMRDYFAALITDQPQAVLDCPQWSITELRGEPLAAQESAALFKLKVSESQLRASLELILFTSGSTAEPAPIRKTLSDLHGEVAELQRRFGDQVERYPVLATVSHQHIYGLLHVLLWPLVRRAPFLIDPCHYPEVLAEQAVRLAPVVLVSSPTHLSRLPLSPPFCQNAAAIALVFSSGGLLRNTDAQAMARVMGNSPVEVLGSTETGGVAYRCQSETEFWQPFADLTVSQTEQGNLCVESARLGGLPHYVMGDRIEQLADGRFKLLGRADTIVKVEGKRLSLNEMQARLDEHEWVIESRVTVVRGRRDEVGAVIALNAAGLELVKTRGKRYVNTVLKQHLQAFFETPLLPRRWRYLGELPRNTQGKVLAADIQQLLEAREG